MKSLWKDTFPTWEDVLVRYDKYLAGLEDPTWYSQKEWEIIYKHSGVVMEVLLDRYRWELPKYWKLTPEQILDKQRTIESYKRTARAERVQKKVQKNIQILELMNALKWVSQKKEEVSRMSHDIAWVLAASWGDPVKLRSLYKNGDNDYSGQGSEVIIMLIVYYIDLLNTLSLNRSYRNLCRDVIGELRDELGRRGIWTDTLTINRIYISIPPSQRDNFFGNLRKAAQGAKMIEKNLRPKIL